MIIDRYILNSLLKPFTAGIAFSTIAFIANSLFYYMKMVTEANIPVDIVFKFFIYQLPSIAVVSFPIGFLFSSLIILGRLSRDYEITALNSCGISFSRIIAPVLITALLISGLGLFINNKFVPYANKERNNLFLDILNNPKIVPVKERVFLSSKEERYFYVDKIDKEKNLYKDIMIFDNKAGKQGKSFYPRLINAESGIRKDSKWVLYKGSLKNFDNNGHVSYETTFKEMEMSFKLDKNNFAFNTTVDTMDISNASKELSRLRKEGKSTTTEEVLFQQKMSIPLATFFIALISAPIGMRYAKKGTYFGASICLAVVFIWHLLNTYAVAFANKGLINPFLAAWIQNILFGVIGAYLILRANKE